MSEITVEELSKLANECLQLSDIENTGKNKGERGQKVENLLGLNNTNTLTDCIDGDLKTTTIGQTIFITQLLHVLKEIIEGKISFDESKVGKKIGKCLYLVYDKNKGLLGKFHVTKSKYPIHYSKLSEDFDFISNEIRRIYDEKGTLHTINGPNKLLQIRTKDSKPYNPLNYNEHQLKDKYMAFYLRSSFAKSLLNNELC